MNCLHTLLKLNSSLTPNINFQFILYISDLINVLLNFYFNVLKSKSIYLYFLHYFFVLIDIQIIFTYLNNVYQCVYFVYIFFFDWTYSL